jgi:hypothetical protein
MARICEYYYIIENQNNSIKQFKSENLSEYIDEKIDINEFYSIKKVYKIKDIKKTYYMTLFTTEYNFNPKDYIEHYKSLPEDKYGAKVLNEFDIEIIEKFN